MLLNLATERGFLTMHQWQAQEYYPDVKELPRCVNQMTIGILGYGNMGKAVAKLFKVSYRTHAIKGRF